ncbi:MAG: UDP-N-acetylmuramoyl-tripeptide--D-alanyl-D-alanine ligase, partial [bacterium]|nr:UDP-N-acetylmuramoyl-tripeptide--D-alanyl-D-alanine ligase [bacterium]
MINESIHWATHTMGGELIRGPGEGSFRGVSTDTRDLSPGELFFCLVGERDGHEFAPQAAEKGAAAIVLDRDHQDLEKTLAPSVAILRVPDTLRALGDLAQGWRRRFYIPLVGLSGSNGKTTYKELFRAILATRFSVLATEGNFNNLIGVPKTLFRLSPEDEIAVIEMGMNDYGEIHRLTEITEPSVGLITNVAEAHLEKLGDVQGVAKAKGELFAGLSPEANALVLESEPAVASIPTRAHRIPLGTRDTDLWGEVLNGSSPDPSLLKLKIHHGDRSDEVHLKLPGAHNLNNALLALAVGRFFKIPWEEAKKALEDFSGAPSRMELVHL